LEAFNDLPDLGSPELLSRRRRLAAGLAFFGLADAGAAATGKRADGYNDSQHQDHNANPQAGYNFEHSQEDQHGNNNGPYSTTTTRLFLFLCHSPSSKKEVRFNLP